MNALTRAYQAFRSITYEPVTARFFEGDAQSIHTRFISDGEWTNIFFYGETFAMRAHWLVAWVVFRIVRRFWKHRRIA
jgi:hypothetical protein